jgi:acyl-homoserine-lactone acylase
MQRFIGKPLFITAVVSLTLLLSACPGDDDDEITIYNAEIRRTANALPHIKSDSWSGLGLGYGYAYAQNNVCLLGREVVRVNGELARYFGPEEGYVESDFVHKYYGRRQFIDPVFSGLRPELRQLIEGFALGYNRYLRDTGSDGLPSDCRGAAWMREITVDDLHRRFYSLVLRAGVTNPLLQAFVADAAPPPSPAAAVESEVADRIATLGRDPGMGSNAYGLGRDVSETGRGLLLANPHFSWVTSERFYEVHLSIPGTLDVMGASLSAVPLVNIGFTRNFAWTHTVSTAKRFAIYELELVPGDPTSYLFDGQPRAMLAEAFTVQVLQPDGSLLDESRTLYSTHFGPMLAIGWNLTRGFSVRDVNAQNDRFLEQIFRMNTAANLDEFIASQQETIGIPWANTIAVDASGRSYYADVTVVPNVDANKLTDCAPTSPVGTALVRDFDLLVLDGRRSACEWELDPSAPQDGIMPATKLPVLVRTDYVANSNNSYWYTNPNEPLTGFSPVIGLEDSELSGRSRLGLLQIEQRLNGSDGFTGTRFNMENLQQIMFSNRSGYAELAVDGVVTICSMEPNQVNLEGEMIDVSEACAILANWDQTTNIESVGDHIFREFYRADELIEDFLDTLYLVPFDPADPINTPNTVNVADATVRANVMQALAISVKTLQDAAIPLTANLGSIQFKDSAVGRIPLHGGLNLSGSFNQISAPELGIVVPGIGYPIEFGSSYILTVTFDNNGPVAEGVLTYSQSVDGDSEFSYDQTLLYSEKQWVNLPFSDAEIQADPLLEVTKIRERAS